MSIDTVSDLPRRNQYVAAASQTVFDYTFPIFADADLVVYVDDVLQALNTDYTVAGATEDAGGTITFVTPLAGSEVVVIYSDLAIERTTDFQQNGPLASANFNDQLDRLTLICRELKDRIGRAIRWPVKDAETSEDLEINPTNYSSRYLYVNSAGELEPAANLTTTTLTASLIGQLVYPSSTAEQALSVVPSAYQYPYGNVKRYGAVGDGVANDTTAIQTAINVVKQAGGGVVYLPIGTYKITAALTWTADDDDDAMILQGEGSQISGSVISNVTNDVVAIYINGVIGDANKRADRVVIKDLRINHSAATKYAIVAEEAPYLFISNVKVEANSAGYGCLFLGSTTVVPDSDNFLSSVRDCDFRNFTTVGVRVNSQGHTIVFDNCKVGGGGASARDGWFNSEGVSINGGQWGGSPLGVQWDNLGAGDIELGSMFDVKIEGIGAAEVGVLITGTNGTPRDFAGVNIERSAVNMAAMSGTFAKFDYARQCRLIHPVVRNPTSGTGKLVEWTANSDQCELICDYEAAQAALTVSASALRAVKRVTGRIARSQVANITTYAGLTTILQDGVDDLPHGFVPVHANGAWNYWLVTLADDAASSFTLPAVSAALVRARVTVLSDGGVTFAGVAFVDADSGGAAISPQGVGADFNTTTGALAGTTGTDVKVTLSSHTDGKIYLENRSGASRDFTVLIEPVIFGT